MVGKEAMAGRSVEEEGEGVEVDSEREEEGGGERGMGGIEG